MMVMCPCIIFHAAIDCTRNIYGRLCSQIVYSLPFDCNFGGCDDECEDELRRRVSIQGQTFILI